MTAPRQPEIPPPSPNDVLFEKAVRRMTNS